MAAIGTEGIERIAALLDRRPEQILRASRMAQNTAGREAKTLAIRRIRLQVALPYRYINSKLRIRRYGDVVALEATRRGVLLSRYRHKPVTRRKRKAGYKVKLSPHRPEVHFRHLFPVPLKHSGGIGLAQRTGKERYPIEVLHAPSVSQELEWTMDDIREQVAEIHRLELQRQIARL